MKTAQARLELVRKDINQFLARYYDEHANAANALHEDYAVLWRAMERVGAANGKRLRPYVMLVAYEGFGGKDHSAVLPVAAALEVLHTCMLIHDDIIDRDYMRYGQPNVAGQYIERYAREHLTPAQREHYANAAALLAGDLALSGSYALILQSGLTPELKVQAADLLSRAIFAEGGGELLDTEAVFLPFEAVDALTIANLKTAIYSFVIPLQMAALLTGASAATLNKLEEMGQALGIAYQLADDLLGIFGDETVTGKPNTSDIKEGKRTYLMQRAFAGASVVQQERLRMVLGRGRATNAEADEVRRIIRESGAYEEVRGLMREYVGKAESALRSVPFTRDAQEELLQLIHRATQRES